MARCCSLLFSTSVCCCCCPILPCPCSPSSSLLCCWLLLVACHRYRFHPSGGKNGMLAWFGVWRVLSEVREMGTLINNFLQKRISTDTVRKGWHRTERVCGCEGGFEYFKVPLLKCYFGTVKTRVGVCSSLCWATDIRWNREEDVK